MGFWQNVEIEREYQDMSRKELASKAGINYASIGIGLERNSIPAADTALRIAKALNTSLEYLLTGTEGGQETSNTADSGESGDGHIQALTDMFSRYGTTIRHMDSLPSATREKLISLIDSMAQDFSD
ncbi:MAG: helix-turn-helix transcriptional regulator [Treponema sp.]|nr:helix-turn-helix transcriptional regulator [Treponema sp.]